jgi:hypothetical protein
MGVPSLTEMPMGSVEDLRKVVQDLVAPDLKALAVRVEALEKSMRDKFASAEDLARARHETVLATIASSHASIMGALEMEKRIAKLETSQIERHS